MDWKKLSGDHSYTEEIAETLKSILFWQKVIVVLFVAGLFLLDGMRPYLSDRCSKSHPNSS